MSTARKKQKSSQKDDELQKILDEAQVSSTEIDLADLQNIIHPTTEIKINQPKENSLPEMTLDKILEDHPEINSEINEEQNVELQNILNDHLNR